MLKDFGWSIPEECECIVNAKAIMTYHIKNNLVDITAKKYWIRLGTRSCQVEFRVPYARALAYKHSFFLDGVRIWKALPRELTTSDSLESFKADVSILQIRGAYKSSHLYIEHLYIVCTF